ncbi:ketoacyl-ACP synthase III [Entomospira entomophila]|uniref:Beta-ketoacyl-[acyl-carrier-protein] synthase III n=1 Tax=Entomospira entomophila TaxID=2719988 RepID=A0A968G962_9SPIO|nr:beta-ketoacyl-ACP synthase III [Entomospira entomophilus]NIZ40120.1 ketoacyl-ACP synthase III [Entomospira entomophilus]WDI35679.1 ketoacyl-ACP synthase III [Entomospira entomophilus]
MAIKITGLGSYLPQHIMTNDAWREYVDTTDEWIYSHTGIKERRIANDEETTAYMSIQSARAALDMAKLAPQDVDLIIVATATPDYLGFPATANLVQKALGAKGAASFDIRAACSGFVYALSTASTMLEGSKTMKHALVIGAEKLSSILNWHDRSTAILFGDGAGAILLSKDEDANDTDILDFVLHSEGDVEALSRPEGGVKHPHVLDITKTALHMDGARVYRFGVKILGELVEELSARNQLTMDDIDWVVPHQANERMIDALIERKSWPSEKFYVNIENKGNTSAASIPLALVQMYEEGKLQEGQTIFLVGFGAGLTWGGVYIKWSLKPGLR